MRHILFRKALLTLMLVLCPLSLIAQISAVHAQTRITNQIGDVKETEKPLLPFGDAFATKALAKELLATNNIEYISHFACRGTTCGETDTSSPKTVGTGANVTQLELTGFHPTLGAVTVVIFDVPCRDKRVRPQTIQAPSTDYHRSGCFAGYQAGWRIFLDVGHSSNSDGWVTKYIHRLQVPRRRGVETAGRPSLWSDVGSFEFINEAGGRINTSDGFWQRWLIGVYDANGNKLTERSQSQLTVPSGDGKGGIGIEIPNLPSSTKVGARGRAADGEMSTSEPQTRVQKKAINRRTAVSGNEEDDECKNLSEQMANVISYPGALAANVSELGEILASTISPASTMISFGSEDKDAGHFANLTATYSRPSNASSAVRRMNEDAESALASGMYLNCLGTKALMDAAENVGGLTQELLLEDGEEDSSVEADDLFGESSGGKSSCDSWTTQESVEINGMVCTQVEWMSCDEDCNCDHSITLECPVGVQSN